MEIINFCLLENEETKVHVHIYIHSLIVNQTITNWQKCELLVLQALKPMDSFGKIYMTKI